MTIILLGAVQGFIVSGLLFGSRKNKSANRLLAWLLFFMALASLNLYMNYVDWFRIPILRFLGEVLPMVIVMPMGPLIWMYTRAMAGRPVKKLRRHFWPVIIDCGPMMAVLIFVCGVFLGLIRPVAAPWGRFIDTYNVYADIPRWISMSAYIWMAHRFLQTTNSKAPATSLKWLRQLIRVFLGFQALWLVYLVPYVIPATTDFMLDTFDWYPLYVPMAVMIYWMGIRGVMVNYQAEGVAKKAAVLAEEVVEKAVGLLKQSMEEDRLYLNPNCNLSVLAQHTGLPNKTISAVLNQHLNKSFNDYVNEYRVRDFQKRMLEPGQAHLTMTGIAFDCGFNSQTTFQRTFKEMTGMSPTEWKKANDPKTLLKSGYD